MARDEVSETIGSHTYSIKMLPATEGWKLFRLLIEIAGPSLGPVIETQGLNQLLETKVGGKLLSGMLEGLSQHLTEKRVDRVINTLKAKSFVDGKPLAPVFEQHFRGEISQMIQWLVFAVKAQYTDFFDALDSAAIQGDDEEAAASV